MIEVYDLKQALKELIKEAKPKVKAAGIEYTPAMEISEWIGYTRIEDSPYCINKSKKDPLDDVIKVSIAYIDDEFNPLENIPANIFKEVRYIRSLKALFLVCQNKQSIITQNGTILSAPGNFDAISDFVEPKIDKNVVLLDIIIDGEKNVAVVKDMGNNEYKYGVFKDGITEIAEKIERLVEH